MSSGISFGDTRVKVNSFATARQLRFLGDGVSVAEDVSNNRFNITITGGAGGGAPTDAQYITLATNGTLSDERVLTAGTGISITDGGAGGAATVAITSAVATLTGTQTLTNKTLTSPVISTISNTGTITLPTATTTLVGRDTTDTLTNKTINLTNNTVTDSSTAAGDLAKSNGTKFARMAMGSANQFLKVNSGATDIAYANLDVTLDTNALTTTNTKTVTNKTIDISSNTLQHLGAPEYTVYFDNSATPKYIARDNRSGAQVATGATLDAVLPTVLSTIDALTYFGSPNPRGGTVRIGAGTHTLSGSMAGFDIPEMCTVEMPSNCIIVVPQGYNSYVFRMNGYTSGQSSASIRFWLKGGYIKEAGTPQHLWDGILLQCNDPDTSAALYGCVVEDTTFVNALNGVHLKTTDTNGLSYINGCTFRNLVFNNCVNMVNFDQNGMPLYPGGIGFTGRNEFYSLVGQSGADSLVGFKDITGKNNIFIGCKVWDAPGGAVTANITAAAFGTMIIGGIMTAQNYTDLGVDTWQFDELNGFKPSAIKIRDSDNSHTYNITPSNLAANRTATLPLLTGNDEFTFNAHTQTLTNKTINASNNTVTNIGDSAIATHTTTKISTTSKSLLNSAIVYNDQANAFANANQNFRSGTLGVYNPAVTQLYQFVGSAIAASRTITLPLLTGNDTMVTEAFTQTLTNKTLTTPVISTISNTGTITLPTATTTLVGRDTTDTLTNKTFDANGTGNSITNIENADIAAGAAIVTSKLADSANFFLKNADNNIGAHYVDVTEMTAPSAPSANNLRLYMDTTDEHLKYQNSLGTIHDITGVFGPIRGKKMGRFDGAASTGASGIFAGGMTNVGTPAVTYSSTNGEHLLLTSGAVSGNNAGHRYANAYTNRSFNPYLGVRFSLGTATNNRVYIGWNNGVDPTSGTDDPLTSRHGIMLVQRSTDSYTNFWICSNNGSANSAFIDTTIPVTTSVFTIEFRAIDASTKFQWSLNGSAWSDVTTQIPGSTNALAYTGHIQTAEAVAHTVAIYAVETTSDK